MESDIERNLTTRYEEAKNNLVEGLARHHEFLEKLNLDFALHEFEILKMTSTAGRMCHGEDDQMAGCQEIQTSDDFKQLSQNSLKLDAILKQNEYLTKICADFEAEITPRRVLKVKTDNIRDVSQDLMHCDLPSSKEAVCLSDSFSKPKERTPHACCEKNLRNRKKVSFDLSVLHRSSSSSKRDMHQNSSSSKRDSRREAIKNGSQIPPHSGSKCNQTPSSCKIMTPLPSVLFPSSFSIPKVKAPSPLSMMR